MLRIQNMDKQRSLFPSDIRQLATDTPGPNGHLIFAYVCLSNILITKLINVFH